MYFICLVWGMILAVTVSLWKLHSMAKYWVENVSKENKHQTRASDVNRKQNNWVTIICLVLAGLLAQSTQLWTATMISCKSFLPRSLRGSLINMFI